MTVSRLLPLLLSSPGASTIASFATIKKHGKHGDGAMKSESEGLGWTQGPATYWLCDSGVTVKLAKSSVSSSGKSGE